MGTVENKLLTN